MFQKAISKVKKYLSVSLVINASNLNLFSSHA